MSQMKLMMAALNAMDAAKGFTTACAMDGGNTVKEFEKSAIADLKRCANGLGFDLVPRKSPAEAHAEAIARIAADDGGAAHAASMGIEDNLWSR